MKKVSLLSLLAFALALTACKRDEQLRVESVVGVYDFTSECTTTDLVTQDPPVTVLDTNVLYVTIPDDDENGYVSIRNQSVYLEEDLSFRLSMTNYSFVGEFDDAGGLMFTIDSLDTQAQTRTQCSFHAHRQ
jgi:hypothetical protein